jgi:hypothetical protein
MGFQFGRDRLDVTRAYRRDALGKLAYLQIDLETHVGFGLGFFGTGFPAAVLGLSRTEDSGSNLTLSHNSFPRLVRLDTSEPSWDKNQPFTA